MHHRPSNAGIRSWLSCLALIGLYGSSTAAEGAIVRVGSEAGCDATTIQQGIDIAMARPGADTVQIEFGNYSENLIIDGHISMDLLIVIAGFDGCTDHLDGPTAINALTTAPTVEIRNGADVILSNLPHIANVQGKALVLASPETNVTLQKVRVSSSDLGIGVNDGATLVIDSESLIVGNGSVSGGGAIQCNGGTHETRIVARGRIVSNRGISGAGIWATDGCEVVLAGVEFSGNEALNGGGSIYLQNGARLTTLPAGGTNTFHFGKAERGGAIYATDAGTTIELDVAELFENEATRGGGLYLQSGARATLAGNVTIFNNIATREGGGAAAYSDSLITLEDGVRIRGNSATDNGGGVYLATRARLNGSADGSRGIEISDNGADYGGGLYLTGEGTGAFLFNYHVRDNVARTAGGGGAVRFGAFLEMNRGNGIPCANPPRCSVLSENSLAFGSDGSALYLDTAASAKLYQTYIEHNRHQIDAASSRVVQTRDDGTTLRLEGIQFWQNDATQLIGAADSSSIVAGFVSAARNAWTLSESIELPVLGALTTDGGTVSLASSILVDTRGYSVDASDDIVSECLIVDDATGLTVNPTIAVGIDPRFHKPGIGDLHLRGDSPAIDYCFAELFSPEDPLDLDLDTRGVDHPDMPPGLGLFDLGIDETLVSPPLFADGFESGDTSAWSS